MKSKEFMKEENFPSVKTLKSIEIDDELLYEPGGVYVTVEEIHDEHMIVKDLDDGWEVTVPEAEYDLYTPC